MAHLVCPSRHTLSSLITAYGAQFKDWSAHYDLYSEKRADPKALFRGILLRVEALNGAEAPLTLALDDTILRKTGKRIPGAAYRRDPLGPKFQVNLVWAQRMIQFSAAVPNPRGDARMIPIDFIDASTPRKPGSRASDADLQTYKELMKQRNLNQLAVDALHDIQRQRENRPLRVVVDGSYTNKTVLRNLPPNTVLIGRIRKDARLNELPETQKEKGRKKFYGKDLPTPEQIRQDPQIPWKTISAISGGKKYNFRIKTLDKVRWRKSGEHNLRLVIIAPVRYKITKGKYLYRQPAYLICTDPDLPLEELVQSYLWRWDIEVNHRDEKTLLGVGEAQVRNPESVWSVPASAVASYAMLHLAAIEAYGWAGKPNVIPQPKWRNPKKKKRASTLDLINELRRELWAEAIHQNHLTDFMNKSSPDTKSRKCQPNLASCLFTGTR